MFSWMRIVVVLINMLNTSLCLKFDFNLDNVFSLLITSRFMKSLLTVYLVKTIFWFFSIAVVPLLALDFGDDAPDFSLFDQEGFTHTLKEHRGQFVLLFFYPRDFIFHSASVAKAFEAKYSELKGKNVVIYGISNDFMKTHLDFHKKMNLTYDLLSNPEEDVIKKYKAKGLLGGKFISYLIGPDGRIFKKYDNHRSIQHPILALTDLD